MESKREEEYELEPQTKFVDRSKIDPEFDLTKEYDEPTYAKFLRGLGYVLGCCVSPITCFVCCNPYKNVEKGYVGLVKEFGRVNREHPEGMHYINPVTEELISVNVKLQVIDLQDKSMVTSDFIQ